MSKRLPNLLNWPYRNIFNISSMLVQRTFRPYQETADITRFNCEVCASKMFLYGVSTLQRSGLLSKLLSTRSRHWLWLATLFRSHPLILTIVEYTSKSEIEYEGFAPSSHVLRTRRPFQSGTWQCIQLWRPSPKMISTVSSESAKVFTLVVPHFLDDNPRARNPVTLRQ